MGCPTPSIPEDLTFDILARLPIKSLMRLKLVCRTWCSLINHSPTFAKSVFNPSHKRFIFSLYNERSRTQQFFTAATDGRPALSFLSLPWISQRFPSRFSNSINGLICFNNGSEVYITNPTTRQTIMLPPTNFEPMGNIHGFMVFSKIYLGHSTRTQSYKVLKVCVRNTDGMILGLEILTVGTQSWRRLEGLSGYDVIARVWSNDALVNGAIYWDGMSKEDKKGVVVVAFDIADERFEVIAPPTGVTCVSQIVGRKEQLFLINFKQVLGKFEVWMMEEEEKKKKVWVLQRWGCNVLDLEYLWRNPFDDVRIEGSEGKWTLTIPFSCWEEEASSLSFFLSEPPYDFVTGAAYVESIYSCLPPAHASTSFSY